MGDIIKFKGKKVVEKTKGSSSEEEIKTASKMSADLAAVLNSYYGQMNETIFAGVVASLLSQIILKSTNYKVLCAKCLNYILDRIEDEEKK